MRDDKKGKKEVGRKGRGEKDQGMRKGRGEKEGEDKSRGEEQADWADGGGDNMVCNGLPLDPSIRRACNTQTRKKLLAGLTHRHVPSNGLLDV